MRSSKTTLILAVSHEKTIILLPSFLHIALLYNRSCIGGFQNVCSQKKSMYHKEWIDFNKNGRKDIYEDPKAPLNDRIEDLLSQMTMEEKTCQMVTLYGYQRVLKDSLPTPDWKNQLWKDGIGAIDEHLNAFRGWGVPPMQNELVWPLRTMPGH